MHRRTALRTFASSRLGVIPAVLALVAGTSTGLAQDDADNSGVQVSEMDLVDLHVSNEDLSKVLQLLQIQSQRNIIWGPNVTGTVTADLYSVTFYEALNAILNSQGLGYIEDGSFIYVYTQEEIAAREEAMRSRVPMVYRLDYLNSTDARTYVEGMLSEGGVISTTAETEDFQLSTNGPTGADTYASEATLMIFDYEENVASIVEVLKELDSKPAQILVETTILQTALSEANAFGVDFSIMSDLDFLDFAGSAGPLGTVNDLISGTSETADGTVLPARPTGNDTGVGVNSAVGNVAGPATLKLGIVNEDVSVFLRVLDSVTDTTIVSNPKLLTLNRQPARVLVGQRVGFLNTTFTDSATTQSVEFLDTGTELSVRPFVSEDGLIRLELRPQISSATFRDILDNFGNTLTIPDEDTTELATNVQVRDGQTIVLGGLFSETTVATRRQVPVLGNIPLIGAAFRGYDDSTSRSEIIFMVTPSIVNDTKLTEDGELGMEYVQHAFYGARMGTLPWSRERLVGQWLIQARNLADEGKLDAAISRVRKALRISPMSPDARALLEDLTNEKHRVPSRSIMEGVLNKELLGGPLEPADGRRRGSWWKEREQNAIQQAQMDQARVNGTSNTNRENNTEASSFNGEEFSSADSDESFQQRSAVTPLFAAPAAADASETVESPFETTETVPAVEVAEVEPSEPVVMFDDTPAWVDLTEREIAAIASAESFDDSGFELDDLRFDTPEQAEFTDPAFASAFETAEPVETAGVVGIIENNVAVETAEFETSAPVVTTQAVETQAINPETIVFVEVGQTAAVGPVPVAFIEVPRFDEDGWVYRESRPFFGQISALGIDADQIEWVPANNGEAIAAGNSEVFAGQAWIMIPDASGGGVYRAPWPTWAQTPAPTLGRFSTVFPTDALQR